MSTRENIRIIARAPFAGHACESTWHKTVFYFPIGVCIDLLLAKLQLAGISSYVDYLLRMSTQYTLQLIDFDLISYFTSQSTFVQSCCDGCFVG